MLSRLTVLAASCAMEEYREGVEGGGAEGTVEEGGGAGEGSRLEDELVFCKHKHTHISCCLVII